MLWFTESTGVAQVEYPAAIIGAKDNTVQTSAGEPGAVEFVVASVAVEAATTTTVPVVLVTTSVSDEPAVGLTPARVELVLASILSWKEGPGVHGQGYLQLMTSWKS